MLRTRSALVLATLALAGLPPAAHASGGDVEVSYDYRVVTVDGVHHVVAECDATAMPGSSGDLAVLTSVTCSINDGAGIPLVPNTVAVPGSKAAIVVTADVAGTVTLCLSASATYLDFGSDETYDATSERECPVIAS